MGQAALSFFVLLLVAVLGCSPETSPTPRFTKNGDGTVTDNLTDLIWLEDANCFVASSWSDAIAEANALYDGCADCGDSFEDCDLSDGSARGDWRLANVRELHSLVHYEFADPAVPNTAGTGQWSEGDPFLNLRSVYYWSSTSHAYRSDDAWAVDMFFGAISHFPQFDDDAILTWPVRGGQ